MSGLDLLDVIGAGFARLVDLAPQFDEATIPVDHDDSSDWTLVGLRRYESRSRAGRRRPWDRNATPIDFRRARRMSASCNRSTRS